MGSQTLSVSVPRPRREMADNNEAGPSGSGGAVGGGGGQSLASLMASGGFAVYPLPWYPHLDSLSSSVWPETLRVSEPCVDCGDRSENWVCLHCSTILCSRYVNGHGLKHSNTTDHCMALSFSDLSVWCYTCDNYIDNEKLYPHQERRPHRQVRV